MAETLRSGEFIVSLDFELAWGVRDSRDLIDYGQNLLGVRKVVPRILSLFADYGIHATWATVGFLFGRDRDELLEVLPGVQPSYTDGRLSTYPALDAIGFDEDSDPIHFGSSLIESIRAVPGQEIGSHTFSHYYCLEPGQDAQSFRADLLAACEVASRRGLELGTIVFPKNQINPEYLSTCAEMGFRAYRGTELSWLYRPRGREQETMARRALRLIDAYAALTGHNTFCLGSRDSLPLVNVPSSRYLRPWSRSRAALEPLRLRRVTSGLEYAAQQGRAYHLWWHPHDFGRHVERNLAFLRRVLERYRRLHDQGQMASRNMGEAAVLAKHRNETVAV